MYKNPKKPKASSSGVNGGDEDPEPMMASKGKGPSAMQPAASVLEGVKLVKGDVGNDGGVVGLVNEKTFLRRRREDVPVDQVGFLLFSFFLFIIVMDFEMTDNYFSTAFLPSIFHQEG